MKPSIATVSPPQGTRTPSAGEHAPRWPRGRALRWVWGNHVLSLADQAIVSAMGFAALIVIGRSADAAQLGFYAIGASALALLLAAQEALVTRPYAILFHRPVGTPPEHAFSSLVLSVSLAGLAALVLTTTALGLNSVGGSQNLVDLSWALAGASPFVLFRELARRLAFAQLRTSRALLLDSAVVALNLALLGTLAWTGRLSAATAILAGGAACAVCTPFWLYATRREFAFRPGLLGPTLRQSWRLGKWLLTGQLAVQMQGYSTHWLTLMIAGAAVTGIYTTAATVIAFANPLLFGFFNIMTPRSVRALHEEGAPGLLRQAAHDSILLTGVMAVFCAVVWTVGGDFLHFLFPGAEYSGNEAVMRVLALAGLVGVIGVPASIALASAERVRAAAVIMVLTAVLNFILVWPLLVHWGLLGAACGVLISESAGSVARWTVFLATVRESTTPSPRSSSGDLLPPDPARRPGSGNMLNASAQAS